MTLTILCTDGSELADHAIATGLAVLAPAERTIVATVMDTVDPSVMTGVSGFGTPSVSPQEYVESIDARQDAARAVLERAAHALGVPGIETELLEGEPARAIVDLAVELGATALVLGTHGRGALKRAVLGSVSDHVVRNAPCPVLVVGRADA